MLCISWQQKEPEIWGVIYHLLHNGIDSYIISFIEASLPSRIGEVGWLGP